MFYKSFSSLWQVAAGSSGGVLEHPGRQNPERDMKTDRKEWSDDRLVGVPVASFVIGCCSVRFSFPKDNGKNNTWMNVWKELRAYD